MKILTVVGARPQFVKAAMVSHAIIKHNAADAGDPIEELILHTGQHYDENMSEIFFSQMGIPRPAIQLNCGGGTHGAMTGKMLAEIEQALIEHKPDWMLVYGDTDSTLAGALAAAKLHIPVAHVEAGLRSFNKAMPEELNRICTDHVSDLLLCPTTEAMRQLSKEGIADGVYHVGDVMYDAAKVFGELADQKSTMLHDLKLVDKGYFLVTCHRAENTDAPVRLRAIFDALCELHRTEFPVVLPLHPRTRNCLAKIGMEPDTLPIKLLPPTSFLDMVALEKHAVAILTDSGGVQKEAYFNGVPCVTLRDETEWVETVSSGWNTLVGADKAKIMSVANSMREGKNDRSPIPDYGDGHAAEKVVKLLAERSMK